MVEGDRAFDYSPIKNAEGGDSPETAQRDLIGLYRFWLSEARIELPPDGAAIEIDPSRVDDPGEAIALGIQRWADAGVVPGGSVRYNERMEYRCYCPGEEGATSVET